MSDGWTYDLSPFISFRDREACERVRAITRTDLARHSNPSRGRPSPGARSGRVRRTTAC